MSTLYERYLSIDEPFLAGLFENEERSIFYRYCNAYAVWFDNLGPSEYGGEMLYPCLDKFFRGGNKSAVRPHYCMTYTADFGWLDKKDRELADIYRGFHEISHWPGGWTHGAPNYHRIIKEGLHSYRRRILARPEGEDFREGLLLFIDALENWLKRSVGYLKSAGAPGMLVSALEKVPFEPAESYYEGLVSWNVIFYFDGCDNLGCLDRGLIHLYRGEDCTDVIKQLFLNIDAVGMWSCTIGPEYNDISRQAIRAIDGRRRPLLEMRVDDNTPDDVWELALSTLEKGNTHPAFYNERGIHDMLHGRFPDIPEEELALFCGCGCTETNLEGISRVGGTDTDVGLLRIFSEYMHSELEKRGSFEDFFEGLCVYTENETHKALSQLDEMYIYESEYLPSPARTLLWDDCIDKGLDYNAGGARYTWTLNSDSGIINVIDSLAAVKKLVFDDRTYAPKDFISLLDAEDEGLYSKLKGCPCYGVDNEEVDGIAERYSYRVYNAYRTKKPAAPHVQAHLISEHQFVRYEHFGRLLGPTPDGRHGGEALCDSVASLRGKAVRGPTAMFRSASHLHQELADGITVINLTVAKKIFSNHEVMRTLIEGYFAMGGIQVQVTVTSTEELLDALAHPEKHRDLIVRVGGYSEYFNNLSPVLKQAIIDRNIHEEA